MKHETILVTGSNGLVGSEAIAYFDLQDHRMVAVENNIRQEFFGPAGDTLWNLERLKGSTKNLVHENMIIHDRAAWLCPAHRFDLITTWMRCARKSTSIFQISANSRAIIRTGKLHEASTRSSKKWSCPRVDFMRWFTADE